MFPLGKNKIEKEKIIEIKWEWKTESERDLKRKGERNNLKERGRKKWKGKKKRRKSIEKYWMSNCLER